MGESVNHSRLHLSFRSSHERLIKEFSQRDDPHLNAKDQRRKVLARGLMNKYTRDLLNKNSTSAKNYYFQHSGLSSLFLKKNNNNGEWFDGSKGLDLNSVFHLSAGIEDETQTIGAFGSFINILRHLLLIPTDAALATQIWSIVEMFVHQLVFAKDDGRKDIATIGVDEFKIAFDAKDKANAKERFKGLECILETMSILFPKLSAGDSTVDPHFQSKSDLTGEPSDASSNSSNINSTPLSPPTKAKEVTLSHDGKSKDTAVVNSKGDVTTNQEPFPPSSSPPSNSNSSSPTRSSKWAASKTPQKVATIAPIITPPSPTLQTDSLPPNSPSSIPDSPSPLPSSPVLSSSSSTPPPPPPPPPPIRAKIATVAKPTMKRFNWTKLSPQQIFGTVFQDKSGEESIPIDVKVLETKFALKSNNTCPSGTTSKGLAKAKGGAVLHLLDPKKAQNLGILLTAIRAPFAEIKQSIVSMTNFVLSVGNAISLIKLLPTEDERALIGANRDMALGKPETFLMEIMDIPFLRERLEGYVLQKEFEFRVKDTQDLLENCEKCLSDVHSSGRLKSLLHYVLDIGNTMNKGYTDKNGGEAAGFKLSSILKLQDTKTSDNKSNLLFHTVEQLEEHAPHILDMAKEMPSLKHGSKEMLHSASLEIKDMNTRLNSLDHAVDSFVTEDGTDGFQDEMKAFVDQAKPTLKELTDKLEGLRSQFSDVASFLGEDGDQEDFVVTLTTFCAALERTQFEVAYAREEAEKQAKRAVKQSQLFKSSAKSELKISQSLSSSQALQASSESISPSPLSLSSLASTPSSPTLSSPSPPASPSVSPSPSFISTPSSSITLPSVLSPPPSEPTTPDKINPTPIPISPPSPPTETRISNASRIIKQYARSRNLIQIEKDNNEKSEEKNGTEEKGKETALAKEGINDQKGKGSSQSFIIPSSSTSQANNAVKWGKSGFLTIMRRKKDDLEKKEESGAPTSTFHLPSSLSTVANSSQHPGKENIKPKGNRVSLFLSPSSPAIPSSSSLVPPKSLPPSTSIPDVSPNSTSFMKEKKDKGKGFSMLRFKFSKEK